MKKGEKKEQKGKDFFTTGQAAKICKISITTINKCAKKGRLIITRTPNSKSRHPHRRITPANLLQFMRDYDYLEDLIPSFLKTSS